jgi:hypothetical protein
VCWSNRSNGRDDEVAGIREHLGLAGVARCDGVVGGGAARRGVVVDDGVIRTTPMATRHDGVRDAAAPTVVMPLRMSTTRLNNEDASRVSRTSPVHSERGARDDESNPLMRCRIRQGES